MDFDDAEISEELWLYFEKNSGSKLIKFTIKLSDKRIDFAEWVDGSKAKFQKKILESSQLARQEFRKIVDQKKTNGFKFINSKM